MAEDNINQIPTDDPLRDKGTTFIAIETVGRLSYGRELRLKEDDVIVALDGNSITCDIDKFDETVNSYAEMPALLTIFRKGEFFEIFISEPLLCSYKYASDEEI